VLTRHGTVGATHPANHESYMGYTNGIHLSEECRKDEFSAVDKITVGLVGSCPTSLSV
jgi:hypothetical protein